LEHSGKLGGDAVEAPGEGSGAFDGFLKIVAAVTVLVVFR
jgi:hypothetical protein